MRTDEQRKQHRDYMRAYLTANPEKREAASARRRELRLRDPEKFRDQERASKEKNRVAVLARKAKYRKDNLEKILEYNRAYNSKAPAVIKEARKRWAEKNPASLAERKAKRRAHELSAMPMWADRGAIKRIYEECKKTALRFGGEWHVDHIIPLQGRTVCGLHVPDNLRVIPATENAKKSNKLLEWGPA